MDLSKFKWSMRRALDAKLVDWYYQFPAGSLRASNWFIAYCPLTFACRFDPEGPGRLVRITQAAAAGELMGLDRDTTWLIVQCSDTSGSKYDNITRRRPPDFKLRDWLETQTCPRDHKI